ncbi:hypothetical protein GN109_02015 [Collimonas pratensis]|uniref:hypothetical protein n=1 Tax=Collimonas pratensis TaxID=279113 RepID=UPI00143D4AA3|nr:hypothetical protein [Collimonas pratensis]NKI68182.1 hypothetical protein [Collimonas pratensis]
MTDIPSKRLYNPDGSYSYTLSHGGKAEVDPEGNIAATLPAIKSVGVTNLADVETHAIHTVMGSTSHYIRFHGGGEVNFAYSHAGQLIELSAYHVEARANQEGAVFFSQYDENGGNP